MKTNYFAAGCFWGAEYHFQKVKGVTDTEVGFMGGTHADPDYEHSYDHSEVIKITYDESIVSYSELLDMFWKVHDPTSEETLESEQRIKENKKMGLDKTVLNEEIRYRSIIFYGNSEEKQLAQKAIDELNELKIFERKVITEVKEVRKFYPASEYHQKYFIKKYKKKYRMHMLFRITVISITLLLLFLLKIWK